MTELLNTAIFWQALGFTTASGIMLSPIYYNGDYEKPIRAIVVLGVCAFFSLMLLATGEYVSWKDYAIITGLINFCFIVGLYIGVFLYNISVHDKHKINCPK
jgi:hypothetical protein